MEPTFSVVLKRELYKARPVGRRQRLAQAYGLLLFSRGFSRACVSIQTEQEETARLFCDDIVDLIGIKTSILYSEFEKSNGSTIFTANVEAEEDRLGILQCFGHAPDEVSLHIRRENMTTPQECAAFLSGAYLACGSITDPSREYHMEFVTPHRQLCQDVITLLAEVMETPPKLTRRRNAYVVYYKESEAIEDLMTYLGGQRCTLRLMDVKIYKNLRNKVNRRTNCETANIEKTVNAAVQQVQDIGYIEKTRGLEYLPEDLRELARLRVDNPDMSLRELGAALSESLTRSGVNHRLARISRLAGELRGLYPPPNRAKP